MRKLSTHHIIPVSRGGNNLEDNVSKVEARDHQYYHALFENKTPEEILDYLNNYFWKNKYEINIQGEKNDFR
jgi:hypothetical protein